MLTLLEAQRDMDVNAAVMTPREAIASISWLSSVSDATADELAAQAVLHRMPPAASCSSRRKHLPSPCCLSPEAWNCWLSAARRRLWSSSCAHPTFCYRRPCLTASRICFGRAFWMKPASS